MQSLTPVEPHGLISRIVRPFLTSQLSLIMIAMALLMGMAAILVTAREEEPQIIVPLADVMVQAPGANAEEVEKLVASKLEKLLWQVDGVEYVYSVSRPNQAVVTVRFFVGEDRERSLVKLYNKINMNTDAIPQIVTGWVVKPVEIDDVPIVNVTLYSEDYDGYALRRIGEETVARLSEVENISRSYVVSGRRREVRVELDPERMAGFGVTSLQVQQALKSADASVTAGSFDRSNREYTVSSDSFLASARDAGALVVGVHRTVIGGVEEARPVYLRDVAAIIDGPEEPVSYSRLGFSNYYRQKTGMKGPDTFPAVTLALAKKKGTNAVWVADQVLERLETLKGTVIPQGVRMEVTRNYGQTAQTKVNDLLDSLVFAIVSVVLLLAFTLGWREGLIVALAVPISFSLALFVNYLFGYTINRVTLFALILSLGLVVDDPITNVDNIQRHIRMGQQDPRMATLTAVQEVLPPVMMSTLAIIVSFMPMFFITGMMGPYMAPMAANVPLAVGFSLVCSLTIVPWSAYHLLKKKAPAFGTSLPDAALIDVTPNWIRKLYRTVVNPFLNRRPLRWGLLVVILTLLAGSVALAAFRLVPLKMLPFDNKNEFQLVVDLPEGATLEETDGVVREFEDYLRQVNEVTCVVSYVGEPSPMDFNGMVRQYYMRQASNLADIRINLADKTLRKQQSHVILLRLRKDLEKIAQRNNVSLKLVEVPPGPPVVATLVAEVYGDPDKEYGQILESARKIRQLMTEEPFVVDVDDSSIAEHTKLNFVLDKEKAALHGVTTEQVTATLRMALSGLTPATVHALGERQPLVVRLTVPRAKKAGAAALSRIPVRTSTGDTVPLAELGHFEEILVDQPIFHKNLRRVAYVFGEMAGRPPAEAVLDMQGRLEDQPLPPGYQVNWAGEGEWKITLDVFRDLGIAFAAALLGIYLLLIIETNSFFIPLLIMMAIPLTLLGIMPGFWLLNVFTTETVGGFANPVFFTATSMIGMIALGGIVIRNSVVLIDFIHQSLQQGMDFREAILDSGAVRFRPIVLTATTTALGAWPITLDPIFSGLAWALIFGLVASTAFTLLVVPVVFFALYRKRYEIAGTPEAS